MNFCPMGYVAYKAKIYRMFFSLFFLLVIYQNHTCGSSDQTPSAHIIAGMSNSAGGGIIPQKKWSLKYADSEDLIHEEGAAINAFDGSTKTYWRTKRIDDTNSLRSHEIQIDLDTRYDIKGFRYLPCQDGGPDGRIGQYEFYVSDDGTNWGTAAATGTFENNAMEKEVLFPQTAGQFVRLKALTEANGNSWVSTAEISLLGSLSGNQPPNGVISTPNENITINVGGSVNFTGTGTDPDNNTPLTYLWNFGNSEIPDSPLEDPGSIQFETIGTFTVTLTVTDSSGLSDPTPATRIITVQTGQSNSREIISRKDWSIKYADSEEYANEDGSAVNAIDGDTATLWHTAYSGYGPPQPHEIQIDLGNIYTINGFRYLPRQDDSSIGHIKLYEFYVSSDGANWDSPIATGVFANDAEKKEVLFTPTPAKYVRMRSLTEVNGFAWTSMAEINLLGYSSKNQAPNGIIDAPSWHKTINLGDSVNFSGTGTDPDNNTPLSYSWDFGNSGITSSSIKDPGLIQFNKPGTFSVTLTVTDSLGCSDPTPATRVITVNDGSFSSGNVVPQTNWSLWYVDSEELIGEDGAAENAFDGDTSTIWHTKWYKGNSVLPHEIQIDLGATYDINGFRYLPRQDGGESGRIYQYEFFVSSDGAKWGNPVAGGTFANDATEKEVLFSPKTGKFIRLRAVTEVNDKSWTTMAEINVLYQCTEPFVQILQPRDKHLQPSNNLLVSASACLKTGYGIKFVVYGDSGNGKKYFTDYKSPFEANFSNLNLREHTVEAFLIDKSGNTVSGSSAPGYDKVTQVGIGDCYIALGDSITFGTGDDDPSDDTSSDGRNSGGGYPPILNNMLTKAKGYPHTIINKGFPGDKSRGGLSRIPLLLEKYPSAQRYLILYGTNDSEGLLPIPSGKGLKAGSDGYPGSFKDIMQQIATLIKKAGKEPCLAKVPYTVTYATKNSLIVDYNSVVDELAEDTANSITVTPPDFYTYFKTHQDELLDELHPNGTGYNSMAKLWLAVLK